jgi:hypothetical protein
MTKASDQTETAPGLRGPSYQDLLDEEAVSVPSVLRKVESVPLATTDISMERYITREWHDLEMERMWSRRPMEYERSTIPVFTGGDRSAPSAAAYRNSGVPFMASHGRSMGR